VFGSGKKVSVKQNSSLSLFTSAILIFSGFIALPLVSNATAPVVTSISPTSIGVAGGTITITGTALTGDSVRIYVGGVEASSVVVTSDTSVSFSAPSRYNAGFASSNSLSHSVTVVRDTLTSNDDVALSYTGVTSTPTVTAISPSTGTAAGGTAITITGSNFLPGRTFVDIGGNPATSIVVDSQDTLRAVTPPTTSASDVSTEVVVRVLDESNGALVATNKPMFAYTITPEVTSVSPSSGTAAGGNVITITGKAFASATAVRIDGVDVGSFTIVSSTSITATAPVRAAASRTVGRKAVTVEMDGGSLAAGTAFYSYRPILIASAASGLPMVTMGDLASRTQAKPITRSTLAPFTVSGTDSKTGQSYTYVTDVAKNISTLAWRNEGHEAVDAIWSGKRNTLTGVISTTADYGGRSSLVNLRSSGSCTSDNSVSYGSPAQTFATYCSVFGPEVYSEAFFGVAGQSLAFDWAAQDNGDDYEIYAYLVAVEDATTIPTPSLSNHTLLVHGAGKLQSFVTSSGDIAASGLYRFRFVNGSYDATGGKVLGSNMYIDPTITVGQANVISFSAIGDQIKSTAELTPNPTITQTVSSSSGAAVVVTSASTSQCTVSTSHSGTTTTVTITLKAHGTCILNANQTSSSGFAPAAQVSRAFDIKESASVPTAPTLLSVTPGAGQLVVAFNPPDRDGGQAITNYEYSLDNGSTWIAASPSTTTSPLTITGLTTGSTHQVRIRAINGISPGGTQSNMLSATITGGVTPTPTPSAPSNNDSGTLPLPAPTATPTQAPRPLPTRTPTPPPFLPVPVPSPSSAPTVSPNSVIVPTVMPTLPPNPGVVFTPSNPIPQSLLDVLAAPLAYILAELNKDPELPELTPSESLAYENGRPVQIQLVRTDQDNGYVLIGDGWQVALEAADSAGAPLRIDDSGNIILNKDRFVQFSGSGFAPGSIIKVWLFSDPASLSRVTADASGNFVGEAQLPEGIPVGQHTVQLNGLTEDGQLRSVSLGVVVEPVAVVPAPVPFDFSGLMNMLWILAAGVLIWFFILWRRRKREEEEIPNNSGFEDLPIFASEGFEPTQQFPNDSRRKIGAAAPPNRKRFSFKPKGA
jgi:IPT/TIG domain/Fibronectin type III domain